METLLILLAMLVLLLLQGFFSGSEIALVNADKFKMRHLASKGNKGARLYLKMFKRPEVILGTTLVGTNLSLVTLTTLGTLLMINYFGSYGDILAFLIYTPLLLTFGEVVPKSAYQQKANILAPRVIYPLRLFSIVFYPIVFIFSRIARLVVRLVGVRPSHESLFITREQFRMILEGTEQVANVDVFDKERLISAVRFAGTTVGEVMVPIAEMTMVSHRHTISEVIEITRNNDYFRLPVHEDESGRVIGVVVLGIWELMDPELRQKKIDDLLKPVLYVSENQPVDEILGELQSRKEQMAIVVDEFGSVIGMVTLEDVLERVVGEVVNLGYAFVGHTTNKKGTIEKIDKEHFRADGRVLIADLSDELGIRFESSYMHTVAGLLMERFHHLPVAGESVNISGYRFTVEKMSEKTIESIVIEPK
jgi:putative hemolysin